MADPDDNVVLRLLREIRAEQRDQSGKLDTLEQRMNTVERKLDDVKETAAYSAGMAVHANVGYETQAERLDRLREDLNEATKRIAALEAKDATK